MTHSNPFRLGVFTRLVDLVPPAEIYARALKLFETAEDLGVQVGWVAQHHAHFDGGLPSPLVFLSAAAARTTRLKLATGIITLPLENPLRLAEDAAVLNALSGGRLELGFGTGGNAVVFSLFGRELDNRQRDYDDAFSRVRDALSGRPLVVSEGPVLFPPAEQLTSSIWEATFGAAGAERAAEHSSGLLLARTAMRGTADADGQKLHAHQPLGEIQTPVVEAYLKRWTSTDAAPRIGLSRSVYVAPTGAEALADAEPGMRRYAKLVAQRTGVSNSDQSLEELLAGSDVHIGASADVIASLQADPLLSLATDLIFQVHPVDPSPEKTLRSVKLMVTEVAPALGWRPAKKEETAWQYPQLTSTSSRP